MISPWEIRYSETLKELSQYIKNTNSVLDIAEIDKLKRSIFGSYDMLPSTNDLKLNPFKDLNEKEFVAYQHAIATDMNSISVYLDKLETVTREYEILSEVEKAALTGTYNTTKKYLSMLQVSDFLSDTTVDIVLPDDITTNKSITNISANGIGMHTENILENKTPKVYIDDDISIKVLNAPTMVDNKILGSKTSILNPSFMRGTVLTVFTAQIGTVSIEYALKIRTYKTNRLTLDLVPGSTGNSITIHILSKVGEGRKQIFSDVINSEQIIIDIQQSDIHTIYVNMTKTIPDITGVSGHEYLFALEKLKAENVNISKLAEIKSKPIKLPPICNYVTLLSEDYIPDKSDIQYELIATPTKEIQSESWINIKPINKENKLPDISNGYPSNLFLPLNLNSAKYNISSSGDWKLPIENGYKILLYNLLNNQTENINSDIFINNGQLVFNNGTEIVPESIKLYSGINDWLTRSSIVINEIVFDNIIYIPKLTADWFEPIDILEEVVENIRPQADTSIITVQKKPLQPDNVRIYDEDDRMVGFIVNSVTTIIPWEINISTTLKANKVYTVKYMTNMDDNTELVENSLSIYSNNILLEYNKDYIYADAEARVMFLRTSAVITQDNKFKMKYTLKIQNNKGKKSYSTWIDLPKSQNVYIYPFTSFEISRGNFHNIDGKDVSNNTVITLDKGMHLIETTQPEPSSDLYQDLNDINYYTSAKSSAGIILENIMYRAIKEPMTQISISDMEYNTNHSNRGVFSFQDNKLLINYQPSYMQDGILQSEAGIGLEGPYFRNKHIVNDGTHLLYEAVPEQFMLMFNYHSTVTKRFLHLKITMTRGGSIAPKITKLAIGPITGE